MKKIVALFSVMMLLLAFVSPAFAKSEEKQIYKNGTFKGISSYQFSSSGARSTTKKPAVYDTSVQIKKLDIHDGVEVIGVIAAADGAKDFHFVGSMFISRKQYQNIEAYVGQIVDIEGNFNVRYFEVKNDTRYDLLKNAEDLIYARCVSFYVERNGINYCFEMPMDELNVSFESEKITELAPEEIDFYANFVISDGPRTISSDDSDNPFSGEETVQAQQARSISEYSETSRIWYEKQTVRDYASSKDIEYEYYALGGTEGKIVDVGKTGSSNWTSGLFFWGHVRKDGVVFTDLSNYFNIKAGVLSAAGTAVQPGEAIEFRLYAGSNTVFTSGKYGGVYQYGSSDSDSQKTFELIIGAASAVAGSIDPYAAAATKMAAVASKLFSTVFTRQYTPPQDFITENGVNKYVACTKFDRNISLSSHTIGNNAGSGTAHQYITFSGFASMYNKEYTTEDVSTQAIVEWSYNMCTGNRVLERETVRAYCNYTVYA